MKKHRLLFDREEATEDFLDCVNTLLDRIAGGQHATLANDGEFELLAKTIKEVTLTEEFPYIIDVSMDCTRALEETVFAMFYRCAEKLDHRNTNLFGLELMQTEDVDIDDFDDYDPTETEIWVCHGFGEGGESLGSARCFANRDLVMQSILKTWGDAPRTVNVVETRGRIRVSDSTTGVLLLSAEMSSICRKPLKL